MVFTVSAARAHTRSGEVRRHPRRLQLAVFIGMGRRTPGGAEFARFTLSVHPSFDGAVGGALGTRCNL